MCGIGAIASIGGELPRQQAESRISAMLAQLHHRGPDETSMRVEDTVAFAFTRLSLVGPDNGSQPLATDDGDIVLVANGEVYNHRILESRLGLTGRMRTQSDCEILLHLYRKHGTDFLNDVRGMFGLILWDRPANKLVLARDRFGIKPLYFHRNAQRIILGSEIKSLFCDPDTPRELDWDRALGVQDLTGDPQFSDPNLCTWFRDIQVVPAATILEIDLADGTTRSHNYWQLPQPNNDWDEQQFVHAYRDALADSVNECATADTELGLFLSGGIDSAAVLALANSQDIHTFSAVTAGTLLNGDVEAAASISSHLGNPHHQVMFPEGFSPTPDQWTRLLWLTETPACGPEIYYKHELHRYARTARPDLRGMLLGAASDEFNGGYSAQISDHTNWDQFTHKIAYLGDQTDRAQAPAATWRTDYQLPLIKEDVVRRNAGTNTDTYLRYLQSEYRKVQQYNVWHDDRTAAGSSIEARVPFLDHRVVEISASVPERLRRTLLWDKQILRLAMQGVLPDQIRNRPKVPFFYGLGSSHTYRMILRTLRAEHNHLLERALAAPGAESHLAADNLRASLDAIDIARPSADTETLLRLVNLGLLSDMAKTAPTVSDTPAGQVASATPPTSSLADLAAAAGVVLSTQELPESGYSLPEGTLLAQDYDGAVAYLIRDGQIEYSFEEESPTFTLLHQLTRGRPLSGTLKELPAGSAEESVQDLLQLVQEQLVTIAT